MPVDVLAERAGRAAIPPPEGDDLPNRVQDNGEFGALPLRLLELKLERFDLLGLSPCHVAAVVAAFQFPSGP